MRYFGCQPYDRSILKVPELRGGDKRDRDRYWNNINKNYQTSV